MNTANKNVNVFKVATSECPRLKIEALAQGDFLRRKQNVVFVGQSGLGKSRLIQSIGLAACLFGALLRLPYEALQARVYGGLAARGFHEIRPTDSSVFRHIAASGSRLTDLAARCC